MARKPTYQDLEQRVKELEATLSKKIIADNILGKQLNVLKQPTIDVNHDVEFEDLFDIDKIQSLQDQFAEAVGVASLITRSNGDPITQPSKFCRLCSDIIRKNEKGCLNCRQSDAVIGKLNLDGPTINPCLSGGLWDAGAGISLGGKHIANWLIGQVRDESQSEEQIRAYAREIGADEEDAVTAFYEVPSMAREQFHQIAHFLFTMANQLSHIAYQNVIQSRLISQFEESEKALRRSEAFHRTLIESIPDLIWLKDPDGVFLSCNRTFERLIGAHESEIIGKTDYDFFSQEVADSFRRYDRIAADATEPNINKEWLTFAENGYVGLFETIKTPMRDSGGNLIGVLGIARDISEELAKAKELEISEQRFRSIIESTPMGVTIYELKPDDKLILTGTNEAADRILGIESEKLLGLPIEQAFPSSVKTNFSEIIRKICRDGTPWRTEHVSYQDDMVASAYEIHAFQTTPNNAAVFFLDISDRLKAEQEKQILQEQLAQSLKMDAIGQLAGGVAHDFNNMLSGIIGSAELLEMICADNPQAVNYIAIIKNATERTAGLTQKLLAFSRKGKLCSTSINLHTTISDAIAIVERSIDKRIEIVSRLEADLVTVSGDPSQLQNSFLNLFINARDAMPQGGKLRISTNNIELHDEDLSIAWDITPGAYIQITIEDSGEGITPEVLPHIFEPFYTTKDVEKGTGLGLAAVYGTIKDHQGDIKVSSEMGAGTVFTIYLPISHETEVVSDQVQEEAIHGKGTILLVDDEEIIRTTGSYILKNLGYKVILAKNGEEGVRVYSKNMDSIDLVILDIVMPVMDGREAFEKIRAVNPNARVIVSSGFAKDVSMTHMTDKGLAGFIMKPFNRVRLSQIIADSLG